MDRVAAELLGGQVRLDPAVRMVEQLLVPERGVIVADYGLTGANRLLAQVADLPTANTETALDARR